MKRHKILPLLGIFFIISALLGSCKEDEVIDRSAPSGKKMRIELRASIVKDIPLRGFNINTSYSDDHLKSEASIQWTSDTWSDDEASKPQLICVVKASDGSVKQCTKIDKSEYTYHKGDGTNQNPTSVIISALLDGLYSSDNLTFYLLDKDQTANIEAKSGTIDFDGGAMLYDISSGAPKFQKHLNSNVLVEPNKRIFFNIVFSGNVSVENYLKASTNTFRFLPVGSLVMANFYTDNDIINNPGDNGSFSPYLYTDAFDFTGKIDITTGKSTTASEDLPFSESLRFESYNPDDNSTDRYLRSDRHITNDIIYVKYVLPRDRTNTSIRIANNNIDLCSRSYTENFFSAYNSNSLVINILANDASSVARSKPDPKYNALTYVAEYNVNKAKDGFNVTNSNEDNALLDWNDARYLFRYDNKDFLNDYHLPTWNEWHSVIPHRYGFDSGELSEDDEIETVGKAELANVKSAFKFKNGDAIYAIRFIYGLQTKDEEGRSVNIEYSEHTDQQTPYLSLWRYAYVDNPQGNGKMLEVYSYLLPQNTKIDYKTNGDLRYFDGSEWVDFTTEAFFKNKLHSGALRRVFPAAGFQGSTKYDTGVYWSNTYSGRNNDYVDFVSFSALSLILAREHWETSKWAAVRPFVGATPKGTAVTNPAPSINYKALLKYNPLTYVAEYNVNKAQNGFNETNSNTDNAMLNWADSKALFTSQKSFLQNYHLPTIDEWKSVVPSNRTNQTFGSAHDLVRTNERSLKVGKAEFDYVRSYYLTKGSSSGRYYIYAIRFVSGRWHKDGTGKDLDDEDELKEGRSPYLSAWRYGYIDNPEGGKMLEVYCYVLPMTATIDISQKDKLAYIYDGALIDITEDYFFEDRANSGALSRVFPATGYEDNNEVKELNTIAYYWSATNNDGGNLDYAYFMLFYEDVMKSGRGTNSVNFKYAVRPFVGATQQ